MVLAAGAELIDDIKRAPEDVLSRRKPVIEVCTVHRLEITLKAVTPAHSDGLHPSALEYRRHLS
jgi:hypothetical protein